MTEKKTTRRSRYAGPAGHFTSRAGTNATGRRDYILAD